MIESVECCQVAWDNRDFFPVASGWVRIRDSDGIVGYGEVSPILDGTVGLDLVVQIAPTLIGLDPLDAGLIHQKLGRTYSKLGPQGVVASALAAIDIALWDLKGKRLKLPIHKLLGGSARKSLPFYASIGNLGSKSLDHVRRIVELRLRDKPAMIKIRMEHERDKRDVDVPGDLERAALVREIVGDLPLAFDASNGYSRNTAFRVGRRLEDLDYIWFEEPAEHLDLGNYEYLSRKLDITVAAGEQSYTLQDILGLINAGVGIVQPDLIKMGGFSGLSACASLAFAHGVDLVPHQTQPGIAHAANLQFLAAQPDLPYPCEVNDPTDRQQVVFDNPIRAVDGLYPVRDLPGLGLTVNETEFERRARFLTPRKDS